MVFPQSLLEIYPLGKSFNFIKVFFQLLEIEKDHYGFDKASNLYKNIT